MKLHDPWSVYLNMLLIFSVIGSPADNDIYIYAIPCVAQTNHPAKPQKAKVPIKGVVLINLRMCLLNNAHQTPYQSTN